MSESPNIFKRMLAIMAELPYIGKGDKKVNGQYTYVDHDSVTEAIQPLLIKHGVLPIPSIKSIKQDNNRTEVSITVTFLNVDNPENHYTVEYVGYGIDGGDKGPGKAISYAYKYALLKTFNIATGDDPDRNANARYEPSKCLEFDLVFSSKINPEEAPKLTKFLSHCAGLLDCNVEDVKRQAVARPDDFVSKFRQFKEK